MNNIIVYYLSKVFKKLRFSSLKNCSIHETSKVESGCNLISVVLKRYSFCGYDCEISYAEIGSFCSIASNVVIGGAMHPISWGSMSPVFYSGRDSLKKKFSSFTRPDNKKTIIGNDVWIGQGAFIKQGVIVGNGAVIGMGAIVTKDVQPYSIVGGNPAKTIRMRFDDKTIIALEHSEWWLLDNEQLQHCAKFIRDPLEFALTVESMNVTKFN